MDRTSDGREGAPDQQRRAHHSRPRPAPGTPLRPWPSIAVDPPIASAQLNLWGVEEALASADRRRVTWGGEEALASADRRRVTRSDRSVASTEVSPEVLHSRFNHAPSRVIRNLVKCSSDAPEAWSKHDYDACDDCLTANSERVASKQHTPGIVTIGEMASFDTYDLGVKAVHGRHEKYVFGVTLHLPHKGSKDFVYLMKRKNECSKHMASFLSACRAQGIVVRAFHTLELRNCASDPPRTLRNTV